MATERKLDLFKGLLPAIDKCDSNWLSKQSPEAQKEFAPVVVLRYASAVDDGPTSLYTLIMVNERVNVDMFDLYKHPDLVYRLMASCGVGKPLRHQWIAGHKRKSETSKSYELLEKHYPEANSRELDILMSKHTKASFSQFMDDCGIPVAEAKEILKDYVKHNS